MLDENAVRAGMRYVPNAKEPWIVEAFDAEGTVVQSWTRINRPDGLLASIERKIMRRAQGAED